MTHSKKIEIHFSRLKLIKLLCFALLFLACGIWMLRFQPDTQSVFLDNPYFKNGIAILALLMGSFGSYYALKKLFTPKPALVIDALGIIDHSSAVAIGRIHWSDITEIREYKAPTGALSKHRFIVILLQDPAAYLSRQTHSLKRKTMEANLRQCGSPVTLSVTGLDTTFELLESELQQGLATYRDTEVETIEATGKSLSKDLQEKVAAANKAHDYAVEIQKMLDAEFVIAELQVAATADHTLSITGVVTNQGTKDAIGEYLMLHTDTPKVYNGLTLEEEEA